MSRINDRIALVFIPMAENLNVSMVKRRPSNRGRFYFLTACKGSKSIRISATLPEACKVPAEKLDAVKRAL